MTARARTSEAQSAPRHRAARTVLRVEGLRTEFRTGHGVAPAVDGLSYEVRAGETLAIVGESGSGKSASALSVMGLIPDPPGRVTAGRVLFRDRDLLRLSDRQMEDIRGAGISMIFQEPMTSFNPVLSIGCQMIEGIVEHLGLTPAAARERAIEMLRRVHVPAPEARLKDYPHQLSGGTLQRIMIAIAVSCEPEVLIADEPTTALDVTIQAQILDIMRELAAELGTAVVLITHDMGVVAEMADRVIVMYTGRKVEEGRVEDVFRSPRHPYTRGLLGALPRLGHAGEVGSCDLNEIPGIVPPLTALPPGCRFAPRCRHATDRCHGTYPPIEERRPGHFVACWESGTLPQEPPG